MQASAYPGRIKKTALISLAVNIFLSVLKVVCGLAGSSQVVVADGVHSFSDSITDIAIIAGVVYWSKPPDKNHPYGHRRIETFVTLFISLVLATAAFGLTYKALLSLNGARGSQPGLVAIAAVFISIIAKEWLFRWSAEIGKQTDSPALTANAWHHRSDALSPTSSVINYVLSKKTLEKPVNIGYNDFIPNHVNLKKELFE